ncbi:MAG: protein tlpB [Flavobacterium sp. BFFFF2]|nr:MAG: protein tlpB [Flavobacterium sp. BFFFF2]
MENIKHYAPGFIRIVLSALFLVSAASKLYPSPYFAISTFEFNQLYPMGFSEQMAAYFSRTLIGIEFALGILLLQSHFLRKFIIPSTFFMLLIFTIHLTVQSFVYGGNTGNCGCFGSLLPMTPIEAIIKNVVGMLLIIVLLVLIPKNNERNHNFWLITSITLASILSIYMIAPIKQSSSLIADPAEVPATTTDSLAKPSQDAEPMAAQQQPTADTIKKTMAESAAVVEDKPKEPTQKKSGYANFFTSIDKGRQTLCFFVPGCDHCRQAAKELTELRSKNKSTPPISIIFMDEETDLIPNFFKEAGAQYPYRIIDVIAFWKQLGRGKDTPVVKYLWNGQEIKCYYGINEHKFMVDDYKSLMLKTFQELPAIK